MVSETTCNLWVWSQPMHPFPLLTSKTFNTWVEGFSLLRYKLSPALCYAANKYSHRTKIVWFFFITLHTISPSDNVRPYLEIPKDFFPKWNHLRVMSWPSGKFQSPRMSQWRWWAIAASRIPCWCPSPSKKNGGNWSRMREVQHGFARSFLPMFCIKIVRVIAALSSFKFISIMGFHCALRSDLGLEFHIVIKQVLYLAEVQRH